METPIKQPITAQDLTAKAFASVELRMNRLDRAASVVSGSLSRIGSALTIGAIAGVGRAALNAADDIGDMSARIGISTEALSQLQYVAKMSGTDFEALTTGIKYAERTISEAARGSKSAAEALAEVGLEARDLAKMSPEAAFEAIGDAISKLPTASDKTAAAMKLFGRSGTDLIPVFKDGAEGVRALREEADRLGLTLDKLSAEKAARANDAIDKMKASFAGLARELAIGAGPAIENIANKLGGIVSEVSLEMDWRAVNEASKQADWAIQVAFADAWRKGGKRGAIEYWRSYQEESERIAKDGLFARQAPLFPGMTEDGTAKALAYQVRSVDDMNRALKSVEVATDGLTEAERRYFQQIEASIQLAQQRDLTGPYDLQESDLMELDSVAAERQADAQAAYLEWLAEATARFQQLQRESTLTWQLTATGIEMVTDQLSNNLAAAMMGARRQLLDVASLAETILGMAFRYAISAGLNAILPGAGAAVGAVAGMQGPLPDGSTLGGKAMSAIPGPGSATTVNQYLTVQGTVDPNNPLSVRRIAQLLYDEQAKIQKHHGPMGSTA